MSKRDRLRLRRRVLAYWADGHDTLEIALLLDLTEAQAANILADAKDMQTPPNRQAA